MDTWGGTAQGPACFGVRKVSKIKSILGSVFGDFGCCFGVLNGVRKSGFSGSVFRQALGGALADFTLHFGAPFGGLSGHVLHSDLDLKTLISYLFLQYMVAPGVPRRP